MDKGAWRATVRGVARFGHDLATRPPLSVQWDQLATFFEEQKNDDVIITTWNE